MNEIVIKKIMYLPEKNLYIAECIIVTGKILSYEEWYLKTNPKLKILFDSEIIQKEPTYLFTCTIQKPNFDLSFVNKPTSWIKKSKI